MSIGNQILSNQILMSAVASWFIAQFIKMLLELLTTGTIRVERLYGNGGMPSSHSATVCGLASSAAYCYGIGSFEFAISFIFAMVVMTDAMGVRRETGKQSRLLNMMMQEDFWNFDDPDKLQMRLKELIGHTPMQVCCGAVLGILIAAAIQLIFYH
ncbi:hypothetical protein B6K86_01360 [Lachnospiraceae bacterium]|jgi:hypothetical protein|nr:hypothetical protein B6K86_01360 [Lachnospiraceae bacterium]